MVLERGDNLGSKILDDMSDFGACQGRCGSEHGVLERVHFTESILKNGFIHKGLSARQTELLLLLFLKTDLYLHIEYSYCRRRDFFFTSTRFQFSIFLFGYMVIIFFLIESAARALTSTCHDLLSLICLENSYPVDHHWSILFFAVFLDLQGEDTSL